MTIQIAPSILSADFCNLERDLKAISNADLVHVAVMDHHFVPNLTLGEPIVARICQVTDLPVDVHLMIEDPDRWAPEYAKLGAASVSFHMGATHAPVRLARQLRDMGCKVVVYADVSGGRHGDASRPLSARPVLPADAWPTAALLRGP